MPVIPERPSLSETYPPPIYVEATPLIFNHISSPPSTTSKNKTQQTPQNSKLKQFKLTYIPKPPSKPSILETPYPQEKRLSIPQEQEDPWLPTFWRRFPWTGALALLVTLLCVIADVYILYTSDGKEVSTWLITPSVYLAIFSAVANTALQLALDQGVVIAWWRKALKGGTLRELGRQWESGDSVYSALNSCSAGRGFGIVVIATIVVSSVVIDGPLL